MDHPQRTHLHHRTHQLPSPATGHGPPPADAPTPPDPPATPTDQWPQQPSAQKARTSATAAVAGRSPELLGLQIKRMLAAATQRYTNPGLTGKQMGQATGGNTRHYLPRRG